MKHTIPGVAELSRLGAGAAALAITTAALGAMGDADTEGMARDAVIDAWTERYGRPPTLAERQAVQAIGAHEGQYGRGWKDHASPLTGYQTSMEGSNNWGAVQCTNCKPVDGQCCEGCGYWYDSRPTADGQKYYEQCFKRYATPKDGANGILAILDHMQGVIRALPSGDLDEIAWQMREAHYFEGFTTDHRAAAAQYAAALDKRAAATAAALGEERAARRKGGAGAGGEADGGDTSGHAAGGAFSPVVDSLISLAPSTLEPKRRTVGDLVEVAGVVMLAAGLVFAGRRAAKAWRARRLGSSGARSRSI